VVYACHKSNSPESKQLLKINGQVVAVCLEQNWLGGKPRIDFGGNEGEKERARYEVPRNKVLYVKNHTKK